MAHLDREEFEQLVFERYARCEQEAFDPYWQRHNRWTGETRNRWIYNDIIRRFWLPPGRNPDFPNGAWIDSSYQVYTSSWPPDIGADPATASTEP